MTWKESLSYSSATTQSFNAGFPYEDLLQGQIDVLTIRSAEDMAMEHYRYDTDLQYESALICMEFSLMKFRFHPKSNSSVMTPHFTSVQNFHRLCDALQH